MLDREAAQAASPGLGGTLKRLQRNAAVNADFGLFLP